MSSAAALSGEAASLRVCGFCHDNTAKKIPPSGLRENENTLSWRKTRQNPFRIRETTRSPFAERHCLFGFRWRQSMCEGLQGARRASPRIH